MTGEEMERAIGFLLQGQADITARQERTDAQIVQTSRQLQNYAETQSQIIQIVTDTMTTLAEAQSRTDDRLGKLIGVVEQYFSNGQNGKP